VGLPHLLPLNAPTIYQSSSSHRRQFDDLEPLCALLLRTIPRALCASRDETIALFSDASSSKRNKGTQLLDLLFLSMKSIVILFRLTGHVNISRSE